MSDGAARRSVLWLIDLQPRFGLQQGAALRWFNLSRELVSRGHRVCFSVNQDDPIEASAKRAFLEQAHLAGRLSAVVETRYGAPTLRRKVAHVLAHPHLTNFVLSPFQKATEASVLSTIALHEVDTVVVTDRRFLFLVPRLRSRLPVVIDWSDSSTLHQWRQARSHVRQGALHRIPGSIKRLVQAFIQEAYYGRCSTTNLAVSPADLEAINHLTGRPAAGRLLLNGVTTGSPPDRSGRLASRLVFTGAMDFPPNYEGAIWFIDHVLPLVVAHRPDTTLVVAGRDPVRKLQDRARPGVAITGAVPDLQAVIAQGGLYVAPLVSGSGFKNKVVEAIAAGSFLAGTSMAVEFLPPAFREQLLVGDTPKDLAARVLTFLENPAPFEARLPALMKTVAEEYSWTHRADEFLEILNEGMGGS